jgi:hypothetical protein
MIVPAVEEYASHVIVVWRLPPVLGVAFRDVPVVGLVTAFVRGLNITNDKYFQKGLMSISGILQKHGARPRIPLHVCICVKLD